MSKRKIESADWPAWAVVLTLPDGSNLVRQVALHESALRCIWGVGERIVAGRVTFTEGAPPTPINTKAVDDAMPKVKRSDDAMPKGKRTRSRKGKDEPR